MISHEEMILMIYEWMEQYKNPVELALQYAELAGKLKEALAYQMDKITKGYDPYAE